MGKIIVKRKKSVLACAIPFKVLIDGIEVGSLKNGQELIKEVSNSNHNVVIKTLEKSTPVDVELTEEKYSATITVGPKLGLLVAHVKILSVEY